MNLVGNKLDTIVKEPRWMIFEYLRPGELCKIREVCKKFGTEVVSGDFLKLIHAVYKKKIQSHFRQLETKHYEKINGLSERLHQPDGRINDSISMEIVRAGLEFQSMQKQIAQWGNPALFDEYKRVCRLLFALERKCINERSPLPPMQIPMPSIPKAIKKNENNGCAVS